MLGIHWCGVNIGLLKWYRARQSSNMSYSWSRSPRLYQRITSQFISLHAMLVMQMHCHHYRRFSAPTPISRSHQQPWYWYWYWIRRIVGLLFSTLKDAKYTRAAWMSKNERKCKYIFLSFGKKRVDLRTNIDTWFKQIVMHDVQANSRFIITL